FVVVDARDLVTTVIDREIRAEQSALHLWYLGHVTAKHIRVTDGNLSDYHVHQVIEIGSMHHVGQHRPVHLFVFIPIRAMQGRHIQIITLVAPHLVEDLLELFLRIEIHAQRVIDASATRLRRRAVRIDDEKRRVRRASAKSARTACASTATTGAIDELATISAYFEGRHATYESCRASIAETIANQFVAGTAARTSAACALRARGFEVVDDAVGAGLQR